MGADSFLFSQSFEIILIVILAVITVLLFTGNGAFMLKSTKATKKRTPQEERVIGRKLSYVTFLWLLAEILLTFFGQYVWVTIAYIVILILSIVYLTKFFKQNS